MNLATMDIKIEPEELDYNNNNEMEEAWEVRYPQMLLEARDIDVDPYDLSYQARITLNRIVPCPFCGLKKPNENQVETRQAAKMKSRHANCPVIWD